MPEDIDKILSSYETPLKVCVMGNEAVARGAIEAGVRGAFAYPGTPSTEISEILNQIARFQSDPAQFNESAQQSAQPLYFEYSINERVALEKAIAFSIGNKSALCCMKNVGMNVASDALMTITYQTIGGPLVIVVCDDPGCNSSSNEQDSRLWGKMASVPVFDPATPEDARIMTRNAFALSERIKLPVIVRMTTRVGHTRGMVGYGEISSAERLARFDRLQEHINIPARTAAAHRILLDKLEDDDIRHSQRENATFWPTDAPGMEGDNRAEMRGLIASGVAAVYAREVISRSSAEDENGPRGIELLKLGLIHPFPAEIVLQFLKRGFSEVLILEELDPVVETEVRVLAQKHGINITIFGKGYSGLSAAGEYSLDIVGNALSAFTGRPMLDRKVLATSDYEEFLKDLPPRPPVLCPGCPHRATFYCLKLAIPRNDSRVILCGDIGCFGLGALPPLQMMDTIHHMGMSISMAQGLSEALRSRAGRQKTVALIGDGTFFHSGIPSLLNAVYTRANILVIIFDNETIGMTGQQNHPGTGHDHRYDRVSLPSLVEGLGVEYVESIDPFNIEGSFKAIDRAMNSEGVAVVIAKSPCVFVRDLADDHRARRRITVDHSRCNTCHNQQDAELSCSKAVSTTSALARARGLLVADKQISSDQQLCPANICNHGFFSSILAGDYREALEIVRDKILFARVCGEICHRPCEHLYGSHGGATVPIKKLKLFVSDIEQNFEDFSNQQSLAASIVKKDQSVAVIGAGPSGLSAAYDLIRCGYEVTIFEKEQEAGGLLKYAIPAFRMGKNECDTEISLLEDLGVTFRFNRSLGKDFTLDEVSDDYDAVVLAIGMSLSSTLDVIDDTVPAHKRYDAIPFLRDFNESRLSLEPGATVLVIGGGNSAVDAARAAKRYDANSEVIISCIERVSEMPAFEEEVESAVREGIRIMDGSQVEGCGVESSERIQVTLRSLQDHEEKWDLACDYVITAIGQRGDKTSMGSAGVDIDGEDRVVVESESGYTRYKNVFASGDICSANHVSLIGAIASGKNAAVGVRRFLEGYGYAYEGRKALDILNSSERVHPPPSRYDGEALDEALIVPGMEEFNICQACAKCDHCIENFGCPALLKRNGKVVIDDYRCTRCGLCIDVCINDAIHWADPITIEE